MQSIKASTLAASTNSMYSLARAIAIGGAVVGALDAIDGVVFFALTAGMNPLQVLQYIASGALGTSAFAGGLATVALGTLIHFALAYGFTTTFVVAWSRVDAIRKHGTVVGLAWGVGVWAFMNLLVLPLSHVPPSPFTVLSVVHGIIGHAFFVGLAAAVVAGRVLGQSGDAR